MSKHVGLTTSCSTEDPVVKYSFFIYDDCDDPIIINLEAQEQEYYAHRHNKRKVLSPQMMDMMTDEEIKDWYERNGRYDYDC